MNILDANGIELAFDSFGDETDETILLIAGLGSQMVGWPVPFCQELATRGYHVVRFDNRDAGRSTHFTGHAVPDFGSLAAMLSAGQRPNVPYTLDDMAHDAVGLLDVLCIDRAHIVGRSMGDLRPSQCRRSSFMGADDPLIPPACGRDTAESPKPLPLNQPSRERQKRVGSTQGRVCYISQCAIVPGRAGERLQRPEITEICRGVAKSFEQGDTYITEMIGVAIAKRVWPEQSVQWRAANAKPRQTRRDTIDSLCWFACHWRAGADEFCG